MKSEREQLKKEIIEELKKEFWITPRIKSDNLKPNTPQLLDVVIKEIGEFYDVTPEQIKGRSRKGILPQCRQIYYHVSKHHLNARIPLERIAKHLSPTAAHCNVIHGLRAIKDLMEAENDVRMDVVSIIQLVKEKL